MAQQRFGRTTACINPARRLGLLALACRVLTTVVAMAAALPAQAQGRVSLPDAPIDAATAERIVGSLGVAIAPEAWMDAYAGYLERCVEDALREAPELASIHGSQYDAVGVDMRGRDIALARQMRATDARRIDDFLGELAALAAQAGCGDPCREQLEFERRLLRNARAQSHADAAQVALGLDGRGTRSLLAMVALMPDRVRADARAIALRRCESETEALATLTEAVEESLRDEARMLEARGIVGVDLDQMRGSDQPAGQWLASRGRPSSALERAWSAFARQRREAAEEMLALCTPDEAAPRRAGLARAAFGRHGPLFNAASERGRSLVRAEDLAADLLQRADLSPAAREAVVGALADALRREGELAWDASLREFRRDADGRPLEPRTAEAVQEEQDEFNVFCDSILKRVADACGPVVIDPVRAAPTDEGAIATDAPDAALLARVGMTQADFAKRRDALVRDARRIAERASASTVSSRAARLAAELAPGQDEASTRALVEALLERRTQRIDAESTPAWETLTPARPGDRRRLTEDQTIEQFSAFTGAARTLLAGREEIDRTYAAELRAAIGDDAAQLAEALLASEGVVEVFQRARKKADRLIFSEDFGGAPIDFAALLAACEGTEAARALRSVLAANSARLRDSAGRLRVAAVERLPQQEGAQIVMRALRGGMADSERYAAKCARLAAIDPNYGRFVDIEVEREGGAPDGVVIRSTMQGAKGDLELLRLHAQVEEWRALELEVLAQAERMLEESGARRDARRLAREADAARFPSASRPMSAVDCRIAAFESLVAEAEGEDAAFLAPRTPALFESLEASQVRLERLRDAHLSVVMAPTDREIPKQLRERGPTGSSAMEAVGAEMLLSRLAARRQVAASALGQCAAAESAAVLARLRIGLDAGGKDANGVNAPSDGLASRSGALSRRLDAACASRH